MCGEQPNKLTAKEAAIALSELMYRKLDVRIDQISLRLFIQSEWSKIKKYAHIIHDGE